VSDSLLTALITAVITGAVNWGILSTKLAYMSRDIAELKERLDLYVNGRYHENFRRSRN
jgi:hypothetical protein